MSAFSKIVHMLPQTQDHKSPCLVYHRILLQVTCSAPSSSSLIPSFGYLEFAHVPIINLGYVLETMFW